ncbi:MAG: sigma-70 family RNA polymerase sigma factor [Cyclobacteriaceae bacterium]
MTKTNNHILSILKGCQKNKRDAQKELYQHYYSYSLSICLRFSNDREDAVEIMNDGFMKVFNYINKFDITKPLEPWLRRIMINCAVDNYNKTKKLKEQVELEDSMPDALNDDSIMAKISYDEMLTIVRKLPDAYRTVFNLIAIEGYKHREVAKMLNISEGTSKSNYNRAKAKLKDYLNVYFEIEK